MNDSAQTLPGHPSPGTWLALQMERRQISVRQIADAMEVTTQTVYGWQNDRAAINEARVPRLAEVLGVSELEARRGLGYWVPDETTPARPAKDTAELERIIDDLTTVLERFRRWRKEGVD
ncbi:helix-turn-helix transcriptional regulator [Streptomyces sp.]|uniref:helix-turn-helix domain-containing protein n=1 Tax=Streptomyces sp. TaxID=1931 RepID=UPI002F91DEAA